MMGRSGWLQLVILTTLGVIALGPILLLAVWSIAYSWFWPDLLPGSFSLRAWRYAFSPVARLDVALLTSLGIASIVAAISVVIGWPAARVIALADFPGKRLLLFLLLLPVLAPPLASTMGMHAVFLRYGVADTMAGVIMAHLVPCVPYAVLVLSGSFSRLETGLEDQARTLGAGVYQVWRYVTLPQLMPGVVVAAAFAFLISWSQYLPTLIIGGGSVQTLPLSLVAFQRSGDDSIAAVLSLIFLAPAVIVLLLAGRQMLPGVAADHLIQKR